MRARLSVGVAVLAFAVLALAQVLLPRIAAQDLRHRLSRSGEVEHLEVHAFPALELLWHHADRVVVRMRTYRSSTGSLARLLGQSVDVDQLDATAARFSSGLLALRDARLRKRGGVLTGEARVSEADVRAALPGLDVRPVASGGGQLVLEGSVNVLGARVSLRARAGAQGGRLVVEPEGLPLGGLATITVFDDPHVAIESVGAEPAPDGFRLSARGRLRPSG
jgi:hypothetical protein